MFRIGIPVEGFASSIQGFAAEPEVAGDDPVSGEYVPSGPLDRFCFLLGRGLSMGFADVRTSIWVGRVVLILAAVEVWRSRR